MKGQVCSGGSGGRFTSQAFLRRAGWAAVQLRPEADPDSFDIEGCWSFAAFGALPGRKQTTARAELWAVCKVLENLVGDCTVWTDHQAIAKIWQQRPGLKQVELLENGDIWAAIKAAVAASPFQIQLCWINSHAERDMREHGIGFDPALPRIAYAGNEKADHFAGVGAKSHEIPRAIADQQIEFEETCLAVMNRLVILGLEATRAIGEVPKRKEKAAHPRCTYSEQIAHAVKISRHTLIKLPNLS